MTADCERRDQVTVDNPTSGLYLDELSSDVEHSDEDESHVRCNGAVVKLADPHPSPTPTTSCHFEECSLWVVFVTYVAYAVLVAVGYIKELLFPVHHSEKHRQGYVPLYMSFESFYIRNVYRGMSDCFNLPLSSCPGGEIVIQQRVSHDYGKTYTRNGQEIRCINFGSYNYLGFAENSGVCTDAAERALRSQGVSSCSSRLHLGSQRSQEELEALLAEFLGVEDAVTFSMGFATNALNLPCLVSAGCLVISDELNHASLILGLRLSRASITVFKHNDVVDLERKLRRAVVEGQPRTHRPWRKILIVIEGVYSMEGSLCRLAQVIALKKKYKAYLYLDEAHSIGAMGASGRGMVEYWQCRPADVDVLMGTFTKSFGAVGGYIAGSKRLVSHIRRRSHSMYYAAAMSAPVAAQVAAVLRVLMGRWAAGLGLARVSRLAANTRYFRRRLAQMGFILYGDDDSPVVPLLIYFPHKACEFVRELRRHHVAAIIVGFPATTLLTVRCRFCVSASLDRHTLDKVLALIDSIGERLQMKYSRQPRNQQHVEYGNC